MILLQDISMVMDTVLLFMLLLNAIAVVYAKDLITSTILLAIFSLLMASLYLVMGAADVAITEAAVGAGISTILILLALSLVGHKEKRSESNFIIPSVVIIFTVLGLLYATYDMPEFGSRYAPAQIHVSPYYLESGPVDTGIPNVVTSILASYRGFDTLGEVAVVFTAAVAILLLLGRLISKNKGE
jgi:multicomponent Na+:H+ antiporter subunit B